MNFDRKTSWSAFVTTVVLASVFFAAPSLAEEHADEHHVQETHVHGVASLFIVQQGKQLLIELESPAMNLVGFEHAPHNEAQHQQVEQIQRQLAAGDNLFKFKGGQCKLLEANIEMAAMEGEHQEHHHESEHDDHEGNNDSEHSDVEAKYLFNCQQPATLLAIDVALFDAFPGVEELAAQWVVRSFQGGKKLNPESSRIELQ